MHRFFVDPGSIQQDTVTFSRQQAHQIQRVLRLEKGDRMVALDNSGWEYEVVLANTVHGTSGRVIDKRLSQSEPRTSLTLYQALLKGSKLEYVLQKCTEIGVSHFVPLICKRCVADDPSPSRLERWRDIIREAAEQSRRGRLPSLSQPVQFEEACSSIKGLALAPWESEGQKSLKTVLKAADGATDIALFTGPEGGFEPAEIEYSRNAGVRPVTLGPRILRAETASVAAATAVLYEMGDLGR